MAGILADDTDNIVAAHDLACFTKTFNGGSDFHEKGSAGAVAFAKYLFVLAWSGGLGKSLDDCSLIQVIGRNVYHYMVSCGDACELQTQPSGNRSQHSSAAGQLHTEAGHGQSFYD